MLKKSSEKLTLQLLPETYDKQFQYIQQKKIVKRVYSEKAAQNT